jgi:FAD/FMN-containing dehydrogenase/Fe-S oxidoreductase
MGAARALDELAMIPILKAASAAAPRYVEFVAELSLRGFEGDISTRYADRTVLATDNSIYQRMPAAVVFPRNTTDVLRVAKLCGESRFAEVKMTPRGGGTGTNGQSLTDGIAVDLSRHMNGILEINPEARYAWVQAGVVKDQLNDALKPHGLFFAPELSPSNRATIGGMIATDASGQGSVLYGKTRNHVLELKTVLLDGTCWHSAPVQDEDLTAIKARPDRIGAIHRLLDRICEENSALIAERFLKLNRCVTGYDLAHLRDEAGAFNLNSVLCGAEGTLGFVTEAKLNLVPIPRHAAIVNIRYATFDAALRDAGAVMKMEAASSETVDAKVLALAREDAIWLSVREYFPDDAEGPAQGVNLVEFLADDELALETKLSRVVGMLESQGKVAGRRGFTVARGEAAVLAIWNMRKKSVGLLGNMQGEKRPIPFVEDTVVPPGSLADYIAEFRAALDRRGLVYGMFGHVDAGCLHVRPAIDMKDPAQEQLIREISDEVFALTRKYKGVLWGEHGKGVRSEYAPEFFGPLYPRLQEIKAAFDPHNQLNPGKIAAPPGQQLLKIDGVTTRGQLDRKIPLAVRQANDDSLHCNGNAACYNFDPDDAMCPSWKATRDRRHSPKGRASLMREWLRLLADVGSDPLRQAQDLRKSTSWLTWPARALNTWKREDEDFSHAVKEAMDGCLACKSCVGQCPIKVDVPAFRSRFLELYHGRYLRPVTDYLVAALERNLPLFARMPSLYNAVTTSRAGRAMLARMGLVALPTLATIDLRHELATRGVREASIGSLTALAESQRQRSVVIVPDAFTLHFEPQLLLDFCELLGRLDFVPWLAPYKPNGKPLHVLGFLKAFERTAADNGAMLNSLSAIGVPLVGLDPSMTLTYRAEYTKSLGVARTPNVKLPQEWLMERLADVPKLPPDGAPIWLLLPHCTERTNAPHATTQWQAVCDHVGVDLRILASGCCGMAGLYGHQAANRTTSKDIYGLSWAGHVANPHNFGRLLATGYSCRSQVKLIDAVILRHPIQMLLARLKSPVDGKPRDAGHPKADYASAHHEEY